jgi:hypothetical protein
MLMNPLMPNLPSTPNDADVTDEIREKALLRTTDMLRKLKEIHKTLELPADQFPIVIETYGKIVNGLIAEAAREALAKRTSREPLTLRSENRDYQPMKVMPGKRFAVVCRPGPGSYRAEDFAIHGDRSHWMVHDVKVGNRSQFAGCRGPALGTEFGPGGICEHLRLETCQMGMDLVMEVEYIGPEAEGAVFEATIVGTCTN